MTIGKIFGRRVILPMNNRQPRTLFRYKEVYLSVRHVNLFTNRSYTNTIRVYFEMSNGVNNINARAPRHGRNAMNVYYTGITSKITRVNPLARLTHVTLQFTRRLFLRLRRRRLPTRLTRRARHLIVRLLTKTSVRYYGLPRCQHVYHDKQINFRRLVNNVGGFLYIRNGGVLCQRGIVNEIMTTYKNNPPTHLVNKGQRRLRLVLCDPSIKRVLLSKGRSTNGDPSRHNERVGTLRPFQRLPLPIYANGNVGPQHFRRDNNIYPHVRRLCVGGTINLQRTMSR